MQALLDGYRAFRDSHWPQVRSAYARVAERQRPETLIIACSDSRVDPHTIFSAGPGELFVIRNVANLVPPFEQGEGLHGTSAAIEFAVTKLEVRTILVLGHARCGGCTAALDHTIGADTLFLAPWIRLLDPAVERVAHAHDAQTALERESVILSLERLAAFPFIAEAMRSRGLKLAGARFGVADGRLEIYDEATKSFQDVT
jgi:carbonic anhydrase